MVVRLGKSEIELEIVFTKTGTIKSVDGVKPFDFVKVVEFFSGIEPPDTTIVSYTVTDGHGIVLLTVTENGRYIIKKIFTYDLASENDSANFERSLDIAYEGMKKFPYVNKKKIEKRYNAIKTLFNDCVLSQRNFRDLEEVRKREDAEQEASLYADELERLINRWEELQAFPYPTRDVEIDRVIDDIQSLFEESLYDIPYDDIIKNVFKFPIEVGIVKFPAREN